MLMLVGVLIAAAVALTVSYWVYIGIRLPPIHDISTDTDNPPPFVAVLPLRGPKANSVEYGGAALAVQQRKAYPHIKPLLLALARDQAYERALAAAKQMGWEIVDANAAEGRIEATARTFWLGFKDDVVVRVAGIPGGSRVDARSVSRAGRHDFGANAKRLTAYLDKLRPPG